MKAELKATVHSVLNALCVEVWFDGKLIGCVYGDDGPGIRFVSKHPLIGQGKRIEPAKDGIAVATINTDLTSFVDDNPAGVFARGKGL